MKFTPLTILCMVILLFPQISSAQLPDGSNSPNFTLDDIDGVPHDLYSYLAQGKGAIIDASATWCGPCWSYHQQGVLEDLWTDFGPYGEDDIMVFMVEADGGTSQSCIYGPTGCTGGTQGDWTAGVDYPIINPPTAQANQFNNDFAINFYPTIYFVLPDGEINMIGTASYSVYAGWAASAGMEALTPTITGAGCDFYKDISLNIEKGYGALSYTWKFPVTFVKSTLVTSAAAVNSNQMVGSIV